MPAFIIVFVVGVLIRIVLWSVFSNGSTNSAQEPSAREDSRRGQNPDDGPRRERCSGCGASLVWDEQSRGTCPACWDATLRAAAKASRETLGTRR
jgi:hypothetical protein